MSRVPVLVVTVDPSDPHSIEITRYAVGLRACNSYALLGALEQHKALIASDALPSASMRYSFAGCDDPHVYQDPDEAGRLAALALAVAPRRAAPMDLDNLPGGVIYP